MEPSPPAEWSPLRQGAARAGRRSATSFAPLPPPLNDQQQQQQQQQPGVGSAPSPPRVVKFAEPQESEEGASLRGSVAGGPKRVGFELPPPSEVAGGSGGAAEDGAAEDEPTRVFAGVSRRKQEQLQRGISDGARQRNNYDEREVDRVDEIPDLEEAAAAPDASAVRAPPARHLRVQPVSELQRDQAWVPAGAGGLGDVDLSLLTACLCPSEQVQEEGDDVWEADKLLAALKSELGAGADGTSGGQQDRDDMLGI